jgi:uncharacterized membrane protein YhaH (DUF805 family)
MQNLSPIAWALRPLKNYAKFSGRASRAEFWWFFLFAMIVYFGMIIVLGSTAGGLAAMNPAGAVAAGGFGIFAVFVILFWLLLFIPMLAVQIRRLHDISRSGWWLGAFWLLYILYMGYSFTFILSAAQTTDGTPPNMAGAAAFGIIALAMFIYSIVLLVFFCLPGTRGPNRFGEDPYGADVAEVFA